MSSGTLDGRISAAPDPLLNRIAQRIALGFGDHLRVGQLDVVLPDGSVRTLGDRASARTAEIHVRDTEAFLRLLRGGATGAGEAYMDGLWSSPDLVRVLELGALNRRSAATSGGWWRAPVRLRRSLLQRTRRNTRSGSRRNIAAHYDLGNDFYRLFLDETMTYSSAVFETPDEALADAQRNKYRLMAERAGLTGGEHVLEIGSGWGGFALYAAGELGCRVTSITVSAAQHDLATERIRAAGLEHLASVQLLDYREVTGTYDAIVSIEMLEAVGAEYYGAYFEACDRVLAPGGRVSIQAITFGEAEYQAQLRGMNWIQQYIFPGGVLPSLGAIERAIERTDLLISGVTDIGQHYVTTLRAWRTRFQEQLDAVRAMGFDERFIRMWQYYLAISEAGFSTGVTQDLQVVLQKRRAGG
jgi:cyclopropane-fatty-acyl-phospholipid synthase